MSFVKSGGDDPFCVTGLEMEDLADLSSLLASMGDSADNPGAAHSSRRPGPVDSTIFGDMG